MRLIHILLTILTIAALLIGAVSVANGQVAQTNMIYLPLVSSQLALPAEGRCSLSVIFDTAGEHSNWTTPTLPKGGIVNLWRPGWSWQNSQTAKLLINPGESASFVDVGGQVLAGDCSEGQLAYEFANNSYPAISRDELVAQGLIGNDQATATPIPTKTNTPLPPATNTPQPSPTATATVAQGCAGMTEHSFPAQQNGKTFPALSNGSIFNLYRADLGKFKLWFPPGEPIWTIYNVSGSWWVDESAKCTKDGVYAEFVRNPLPEKNWGELCPLGVTCPPSTPTPTPSPSPTPFVPCTMELFVDTGGQVDAWEVPTQPSGQGGIIYVWRDGVTWWIDGQPKKMAKVIIHSGEQPWLLKDSGGSFWNGTCSDEQLQYEFNQHPDAAASSWQELRDLGFIR